MTLASLFAIGFTYTSSNFVVIWRTTNRHQFQHLFLNIKEVGKAKVYFNAEVNIVKFNSIEINGSTDLFDLRF